MSKTGLVGIKEAAEILGVRPNTLYSWIHLRKILHYKVGRLVKFRKNDLLKLIAKNKIAVYAV